MARTLILVPVMYSREDLKGILGLVPEDFEETSSEFWGYVEERLKALGGRVHVVYSEKPVVTEGGSRLESLFRKLSGDRTEFHCVEDSLLVAETESWLELMKKGQNRAILELFEESMKERNEYAWRVIDETLGDGEIGILFADPARRIPFPDDVRVIRMCPFDPVDYLNRHMAKLRIVKRRE